MLYSHFILEAEKKTINQFENGIWYLEPEWKDIICRDVEKDLDKIENNYLTDWWDIENLLRLEVDKRNAQNSKKEKVIDYLYELITSNIEPAVLDEETKFIAEVVNYMKESHKE